jgi:molybdenum cofactor synthesis domain-containing protein
VNAGHNPGPDGGEHPGPGGGQNPGPDGGQHPGPDGGQHPGPVVGRALVITASNRASAGVYADTGGPVLVAGLRAMGFGVDGPVVVPDGDPVQAALRDAVDGGYDVVLTTGGTGLSPTDRTPEATLRVVDRLVPGIAEAVRAYGVANGVPTAALSRGVAGLAAGTLVVNLPGSRGGCSDGVAVLREILPHAVHQIRGADHARPDDRPDPGEGRLDDHPDGGPDGGPDGAARGDGQ